MAARAPQLADAALLIALYRVALDGNLIEGALAAGTVELGAVDGRGALVDV